MSTEDAASDEYAERQARMMQVLSLAIIGEYGAALDGFAAQHEDRFGMLEEGLRLFIHELKVATAEREQAMLALQLANREIEAKLALIESQRAAIRELSSPILDLWEGIVAVPLVGTLDHDRAYALTEKLLGRVVAVRARWTLLDLTGVDTVDAATADHIVGLARALTLIGGKCILTGINPETAAVFVSLDTALGQLRCLPNLREALRHCLVERAARRAP
jgi:rsbT co-antagonist protein RsbR